MYKTVLVPLDGSQFSEHALPLALDVARKAGGTLRLTHVQLPMASVYSEAPLFLEDEVEAHLAERERSRWQGYLDGVAGRVRQAAPGVAVATIIQQGEPAETLQRDAEAAGADLVVMTTHARGALGRLWLGSVADELLRHLRVPLLLIRPGNGTPDLTAHALPRQIVVPLDGTPLAEQMIRPAAELGKLSGAGITLLRVIKPVVALTPQPVGGASMGQMAAELVERLRTVQDSLRKEAIAYLESVARPLRAEGLHVLTRVALEEQPALAVLHEAEAQGAGLVALATHGRRGISRLVLGSVADKVVRGAQFPVLLCRPRL
jgi:nucleotide-binding universal stress UspA family protein